jgi:glycosyltransferase involved in cell wall biosynthesis
MKSNISAFVLAYNDAGGIGKVIEKLSNVLPRVADKYEIIIVFYQGSTDGTEQIIADYMKKDKHIRIVPQPQELKGYGEALRRGIKAARYPLVFYTDGDYQYDPDEIKILLERINGADIVSGRRVKRSDPKLRIVTAAVYNCLLRSLFHLKVKDVDSAFKIYRKDILDRVEIICRTGLADAEILAKAQKIGATIVEVPINHLPRMSGTPVFEVGILKNLGLIHPRVILDLLREMRLLKKSIAELK